MRTSLKLVVLAALWLGLSASEGIGGLLVTRETWRTPAPQFAIGGAVFYSPQVMEANCQWRGYDMTGYTDGIAMLSPADLGKTVWLKRPGGQWEKFRVCDCAMRGDFWQVASARREILELGWKTAKKWGMGPFDGGWRKNGILVWVGDQPPRKDQADDYPVDYREWVMKTARFETP